MVEENYYRCPECQGKRWSYYSTNGSGMISATCSTCKGKGVMTDLELSTLESENTSLCGTKK